MKKIDILNIVYHRLDELAKRGKNADDLSDQVLLDDLWYQFYLIQRVYDIVTSYLFVKHFGNTNFYKMLRVQMFNLNSTRYVFSVGKPVVNKLAYYNFLEMGKQIKYSGILKKILKHMGIVKDEEEEYAFDDNCDDEATTRLQVLEGYRYNYKCLLKLNRSICDYNDPFNLETIFHFHDLTEDLEKCILHQYSKLLGELEYNWLAQHASACKAASRQLLAGTKVTRPLFETALDHIPNIDLSDYLDREIEKIKAENKSDNDAEQLVKTLAKAAVGVTENLDLE